MPVGHSDWMLTDVVDGGDVVCKTGSFFGLASGDVLG